jgi:hypothetical protein
MSSRSLESVSLFLHGNLLVLSRQDLTKSEAMLLVATVILEFLKLSLIFLVVLILKRSFGIT